MAVQVFYEGVMGRIGLQTFVEHKRRLVFYVGKRLGGKPVCGSNGGPLTRDKLLHKNLFRLLAVRICPRTKC